MAGLTRVELLTELRRRHRSGDPESAHAEADDLLLAYINDPEIGAAYEKVPKWYA